MSDQPRPVIEACLSMDFEEFAYVVHLAEAHEAVVIDPGLDPDGILDHLDASQLRVVAVLNTHGHGDHIAGNGALMARFPDAALVIGRLDAPALTDGQANLSAMFGFSLASPPASRTVDDADRVEAAGMVFEVLHVPGHTVGHVAYLYRSDPIVVFGGDLVFAGSIGRSDFPGGSHVELVRGIRDKLLSLPDETVIYPGHGPQTTVGRERTTNPFLI